MREIKEFSVLVVGYGQNSFGRTVAQMIRRSFRNCHVNFIGEWALGKEMFAKFDYKIVVCDFFLNEDRFTGVDFLLQLKKIHPVKTILLAKKFNKEQGLIQLDTIKLLNAVDCIWQREPSRNSSFGIKRVRKTIGDFLQEKNNLSVVIETFTYFQSRR